MSPAKSAPSAGVLGAIAAGGALGALARWGISLILGQWDGLSLPVPTLLANLLGCLAIGMLAGLPSLAAGPALMRPFLITGVLGGFTTFSALALEVGVLAETGKVLLAAAYLGLSVAGGLGAVALGRWAVRR